MHKYFNIKELIAVQAKNSRWCNQFILLYIIIAFCFNCVYFIIEEHCTVPFKKKIFPSRPLFGKCKKCGR